MGLSILVELVRHGQSENVYGYVSLPPVIVVPRAVTILSVLLLEGNIIL